MHSTVELMNYPKPVKQCIKYLKDYCFYFLILSRITIKKP